MSPESAASATPNLSDFDAILAPNAAASAATSASPRASATARAVELPRDASATHTASVAVPSGPTLAEFAQNWSLYRDPILCGVLAGAGLGALGVFVVLRRAVFVTAALSQAAGLGVALAFFAEIHLGWSLSPVLGALAASLACTLLVTVRSFKRISRETLIALAFVGASALAVIVGDRIAQEAHDIAAILFGTAVLVRPIDLALVACGTLLSSALVLVFGRLLSFTGFDPEGARVQRVPVQAVDAGFWSLFALEVAVATRALGSLPVFAFAVLPAAAALVLVNRLASALVVSLVLGALAGGLGYVAAFVFSLPVGASQAATACAFAFLAYVVSRLRGD